MTRDQDIKGVNQGSSFSKVVDNEILMNVPGAPDNLSLAKELDLSYLTSTGGNSETESVSS